MLMARAVSMVTGMATDHGRCWDLRPGGDRRAAGQACHRGGKTTEWKSTALRPTSGEPGRPILDRTGRRILATGTRIPDRRPAPVSGVRVRQKDTWPGRSENRPAWFAVVGPRAAVLFHSVVSLRGGKPGPRRRRSPPGPKVPSTDRIGGHAGDSDTLAPSASRSLLWAAGERGRDNTASSSASIIAWMNSRTDRSRRLRSDQTSRREMDRRSASDCRAADSCYCWSWRGLHGALTPGCLVSNPELRSFHSNHTPDGTRRPGQLVSAIRSTADQG